MGILLVCAIALIFALLPVCPFALFSKGQKGQKSKLEGQTILKKIGWMLLSEKKDFEVIPRFDL